MKTPLIGLLSLSFALAAAPCFAEGDFYVELGKDSASKEQAQGDWQALVAKHQSLLGKLRFYPKSVISNGAAVATRIQAGPIASKARAQKICAKLFSDDMPCFVIEGNGEAPPSEVMTLSEKSASLPWLAKAEAALPWLASKPDERQGKVQVAEAIRVPLSNRSADQGTISVSELKPTFRKPVAGNPPEAKAGANWLTLDGFANEEVATSFWDEARSALPKKDRSLHVRVMKPMMAASGASLGVGPFASGGDADAFCEKIQAKDRGLSCNYAGGETRVADNNHLGSLAPAAGSRRQYWVQVLSAPDQMGALRQWESMKAANADVLNGMRSSVSAAADKHDFVVRVGPIAGNDDAVQFCSKLQGRGIDCRVLLYKVGL